MLERARGESGLTVKRLEKMVLRERAAPAGAARRAARPGDVLRADRDRLPDRRRSARLQEPSDRSNIPDAAIDGSQRASDLHMKIEYLRGRHGHRVVTIATATPIANSVTEAHVMARYLRPDLFADAGVEDFDAWAATFGQTVTEIEMAPTGGGDYRMNTRFARFQNVPEMLRIWHVFADVKTAEDLELPAPEDRGAPRRAARPGDGGDPRFTPKSPRTSASSASALSGSARARSHPKKTTC